MKNTILEISRQTTAAQLTPWFNAQLDKFIKEKKFRTEKDLHYIKSDLVQRLVFYREETGVENVVLGISGGVDSALTAALFKEAGWVVYGICMPIHQNQAETDRGVYACEKLGINYTVADLTNLFEATVAAETNLDRTLNDDTKEARIRRGNIRARLRMITLYNTAAKRNGLVASTDNFTELAAGFWTLHGDVGDVSPIQSLFKSWEVPMLAKIMNVPESIWRATPTDGLGIDESDEAQFGCTYLEYDLILMTLLDDPYLKITNFEDEPGGKAKQVAKIVTNRLKNTWFKRENPVYLLNRLDPNRFNQLDKLDNIFKPQVVKNA